MKKIFTLLFVVGSIAAAQAQSRSFPDDRSRDRDVILGQRNDRGYEYDRSYERASRYSYSFTDRERDKQLDRINHDYDKRIRKIEKDRRMSSYEKNNQIRYLESQRRDEVRRIWDRYRSSS